MASGTKIYVVRIHIYKFFKWGGVNEKNIMKIRLDNNGRIQISAFFCFLVTGIMYYAEVYIGCVGGINNKCEKNCICRC